MMHIESVKAWVDMSWVRTVGSLNRLGASKIFSDPLGRVRALMYNLLTP
jgi:hypothetical protein